MEKYKSRLSTLEALTNERKTEASEFYKVVEKEINRRTRAALYTEERRKEMD